MIVDNQKNQRKEIKLILRLFKCDKSETHFYPFKKRREGKEAVFKRVEEKLGRRYNLTATKKNPSIPLLAGGRFYRNLDSFFCNRFYRNHQ